MKKIFFHLLLHRAGASPRLKRRIKIFAALSLVGVFLAGGLAIWAGVAAFDYAAGAARSAHTAIISSQDLQSAGKKLAGEQPLLRPGCLARAQGMLNLSHWLEKPLQQSYRELRQACLEGT